MYRRYTSRSGGINPGNSRLRERIRTGVIIVLLIAVVVLAIFGGRAMVFRADTHTLFVRRMQTECASALSLTASLSRTAGANSSATLGSIRSRLYAMDVINQFHVGLEGAGQYLVDNDLFTQLYSMLDDYSNQLMTGMATGDMQTSLTTSLNNLLELVNALN